MAAAEVTYADVKFPKSKAKAVNRLSTEVTYSEVRRLRKLTEDSQSVDSSEMRKTQPRRQTKPRLTAERVALLVLSVLLAAAIIVLSVIQIKYRNTHSELEICKTSPPPSCPPPPKVRNETCLKCEAGWEQHGGNCYYFNNKTSSWNDSRGSCINLGSDLVKIDSREEQMFLWKRQKCITSHMKMNEIKKFWIGLTCSTEEDKCFWVDGSPLNQSLSFWSEDQPGNKHGGSETVEDQNCVRMGKKTKDEGLKNWLYRSCGDRYRSICEKLANVSQCFCL